MKRFIIRTLIFSFLPIITIISVNLYADPAYLFKQGKIEKQIAEHILNGYNVNGITNLNERLLQKYIIENTPDTIKEIVLGSSRGMLIDKNLASNRTSFFNHSVSGGSLEDFLGIYNLYIEQEKYPTSIIIELSPWVLNDNCSTGNRWKTLLQNYRSMSHILQLSSAYDVFYFPNTEFLELVSPSYFQESYRNLMSNDHIKSEPIPSTSPDSINATILTDGSRLYDQKYNQTDSAALSTLQSENIGRFVHWGGFDRFQVLSSEKQEVFSRFIQYLQQKDTKLLFLLTPFHPLVYNELKKLYPIEDTENFFYSFAAQHNIKITGSYNPEKYNFSIYDFHDGMHPRKHVYQTLLWNE